MVPVKLTNKQMYNFIKEGYVVIQPDLNSKFHTKIQLSFIGGQISQSFVNISKRLQKKYT